MPRVKLTLAYHGAGFVGWQYQENGLSVQETVERALAPLLGAEGAGVRVHGSGRTDSGVHAVGQVAHFDAPETRRGFPWQRALNSRLPRTVCVVEAEEVADDFHARFDVLRKTYAYTLWLERRYVHPQRREFVWDCGPLDLAAMDEAALYFLGEHDFAAFRNAGGDTQGTVREILTLERGPGHSPLECVWRVTATGFLKQMVRNIVGCLVAVGQGKVRPDFVRSLLDEGDRTLAPQTAPARGLCLERVEYPPSPSGGSARDEHQMGSEQPD
ncbi:MAG: tRNA pseudouridine(38-40) synthase TruA [Desulfovibrionaceae bacterium]